jgi:hypothetical protein
MLDALVGLLYDDRCWMPWSVYCTMIDVGCTGRFIVR